MFSIWTQPRALMEIWTILFPILLTDIVNPVLFAFMVFAASSGRPVLVSSSMLLGHTLAYFGAGIVLALFMESITDFFANPRRIDFIIELILGVALLWVALGTRKSTGKRPEEAMPEFTPLSAFGFGAVVNFIGIPFAVPYFAAIDQVIKADFSNIQAAIMLLSYNLAYAVPFMLVPVLSALMGKRARPILEKINRNLDKVSGVLMPLLLGLVGLALLADAIFYFVKGSPLF
jgi:cytochrome c biogenesis protein CcdA